MDKAQKGNTGNYRWQSTLDCSCSNAGSNSIILIKIGLLYIITICNNVTMFDLAPFAIGCFLYRKKTAI